MSQATYASLLVILSFTRHTTVVPTLQHGTTVPRDFHSVDIYLLICKILNLKPAPNNGSEEMVKPILKMEESWLTEAVGRFGTNLLIGKFDLHV